MKNADCIWRSITLPLPCSRICCSNPQHCGGSLWGMDSGGLRRRPINDPDDTLWWQDGAWSTRWWPKYLASNALLLSVLKCCEACLICNRLSSGIVMIKKKAPALVWVFYLVVVFFYIEMNRYCCSFPLGWVKEKRAIQPSVPQRGRITLEVHLELLAWLYSPPGWM